MLNGDDTFNNEIIMFTEKDIVQLKNRGLSEEALLAQVERFKSGFGHLNVIRPATLGDGIRQLNEGEIERYSGVLAGAIENGLTVSKFVPASGAATRMFKDLYSYLENPVPVKSLPGDHAVVKFIELLPRFAFFPILAESLKTHNLNNVHVRKSKATEIIKSLLSNPSLNYGNLPKGLVHFHGYPEIIRTAMEEHLVEGVHHAANGDGMVKVHFTISPEHHALFKNKLYEQGPGIENSFSAGLDVTFSFQKASTDTLAVTPTNLPFRDEKGNLLFRPGGHGALINNLSDQDSDIIYIKNIDNVAPLHLLNPTIRYKKALGGLIIEISKKVHDFIKRLELEYDEELLSKIKQFLYHDLYFSLPPGISNQANQLQASYLMQYLNRPIRICGMVKNQGEPGGGPFWVGEASGRESLQILESSQFNFNDPKQISLFNASTHFNPVDLVCSTRDYKGRKFDLAKFVDPETGFISEKSFSGQPLKALELPGLWNGAMSNWITLFVEVPVETFNPVKTINDLLRPQHQPDTKI